LGQAGILQKIKNKYLLISVCFYAEGALFCNNVQWGSKEVMFKGAAVGRGESVNWDDNWEVVNGSVVELKNTAKFYD